MNTTIAFLGLGRMGLPMSLRLLAAGFPVHAWNRTAAARRQLAAQAPPGSALTLHETAAGAVAGVDLVITMLSDGPTVRQVLFADLAGGAGLLAAAAADADLIDMSSIPPAMAREHADWLAGSGHAALDAPVSGGVSGAREGSLAIMAGGEAGRLARHSAVLAALGRVTRVGPPGAGQLAKLANQVIVGITIGAVAEALLLAARGGADPAAVRAAIRGGFAESRILELHGARMLAEDYQPGGAVRTQLKDLATALDEARAAGLDLPVTRQLHSLFDAAREHGDGDLDHAALLRELGRCNGLPTEGLLRP